MFETGSVGLVETQLFFTPYLETSSNDFLCVYVCVCVCVWGGGGVWGCVCVWGGGGEVSRYFWGYGKNRG